MADKKVSELIQAGPLARTDQFKLVQNSETTPASRRGNLEQVVVTLSTLFYKGAYSGGTTYQMGDLVEGNGGLYQSQVANNLGQSLVDTTKWKPVLTAAVGAAGQNAFTTTSAQFTMPAVSSTVTVNVASSSPFIVGQNVHVESAGEFSVTAKPSGTQLTLLNLGYTGNAAPTTVIATAKQVSPSGKKGTDGEASFATTTAQFTMPAVSGTVTVAVDRNAWAYIGQTVTMQTAGALVVTALPTSTSITLRNDGAAGNASPGTTIATGRKLHAGGSGTGGGGGTRTGVYREHYIDAGAMAPRATAGAGVATIEDATYKHTRDILDFDQTTQEYASFKFKMPSAWNGGTIKAKLDWEPGSGFGTGQSVVWGLSVKAYNDGELIDTIEDYEVVIADASQGAGKKHTTPATPTLQVQTYGGLDSNATLIFTVTRVTGHASDNGAGDARLWGIAIQHLESETEPTAW